MSSFKMSTPMTSGQAQTSAVIANQESQLATAELHQQVLYYNNTATSSSTSLTFDGSVLDIVGSMNVSDNMMVGEEGVEGSMSPQAFEFVTTNPEQVRLDVHNNSVSATTEYDYRMFFTKGATSGSGGSSLGLQGKETSFFNPLSTQPEPAPGIQPTAPSFFLDYGVFNTAGIFPPSANRTYDIPFHTVFRSIPQVQVTINSPLILTEDNPSYMKEYYMIPYVRTITTTGCRVQLYGGGINNGVRISWLAVGCV